MIADFLGSSTVPQYHLRFLFAMASHRDKLTRVRNSMQPTLKLKPVARSRTGVEYGTGPVMLYEVEGLADGQKISIRNVRPAAQEPVWQIGAHIKGRETRWTGTFESAEEALAQLQEQLDSVEEEGETTGVSQ
jgi:hypothetical protein